MYPLILEDSVLTAAQMMVFFSTMVTAVASVLWGLRA
jgi:hypothetical protein